MTLLAAVYQDGLWLAPPVLCLAVMMLVAVIFSLVALVRKSVIVRVPFTEVQKVEFPEAGRVILCMEGPLLPRRFRGLHYRLVDMAGKDVPGRFTIPVSSSGLSRGRRTLWQFTIPRAGWYVLYVEPIGDPQPNDASHEFVFTRPHVVRVIAYILGIIAASHLLIGSIVLFSLRILDKSAETEAASAASSGTLVSVTWIAAVFIVVLAFAIWSNRRHRNAVGQFATAQGWRVSNADTLGIGAAIGGTFPDRTFTCSLTMTVESGERRLYLVDGTYSQKGPKVNVRLAAACVLESERLQGVSCRVEIQVLNWLDKALLPGQVALGDSEFAQQYIVLCEAPAAAQALLNPAVQEVLVAHAAQPLYNPVEIAVNQGRMTLITTSIEENARWFDLLQLAKKIESAL